MANSEFYDFGPFKCLGHDRGVFFYHSAYSNQLTELTPTQHTEMNLRSLAQIGFWFGRYAKEGKAPDFKAAAEEMMHRCMQAGVFDKGRIRGRGAWYDDGKCVLNLGDRAVLGSEDVELSAVPSRYLYEAGHPLSADVSNPLSTKEANQCYELISMLPWERPISARLLAGFCVCAHIGGVLTWRPHLWLIGRKGSGKTHVMNGIVKRILGTNCLFALSDTTEAGIRQTLGGDSLPVMFDEAEGTDARAVARLQNVLGLVRQSSSETGGQIIKGSSSGKSVQYNIRSCFVFSSINSSLMQESDNSRVTVLELNQDHKRHEFKEILDAEEALFANNYVERFYARAISLAPIIRENARVFASAVAAELGEQRAGDQIGALLAGAYSLHSPKPITYEAAKEWVRQQDWSQERTDVQGSNDENALLHYLLSQTIKFRPSAMASFADVPIGRLIDAAAGTDCTSDFPRDQSAEALIMIGIKVHDRLLIISNTSPHIKKLLANTPWALNASRVLRRLPGAHASDGNVYFGHRGSESRATIIPLDRS